jgi:DNA-binding response OmpR family regulator
MSERTDRTFTVDALWAGADQVLAKPFFLDEFAARVQALLRLAAEPQSPRYAAEASSENLEVQEDAQRGNHRFSRERSLSIKQFGRIRVNPFDKRVVVGTHVIDFTESEFIVIEALAANQGSIVHKEEMNLLLHGHPEMEKSKVVDVLLSRIRKKLADALGSNQVLIANYRGRGWSLELGEEPTNGASNE